MLYLSSLLIEEKQIETFDELLDVIEINEKKAADIIMKARESWFN